MDALELARTLTDHGGFEVETLINAEAQTVQRRIEKFCKTGRHHTDTLFVYLTGHGVKDDDANLYFALRDTDRDLLRTTALSADLLAAVLDESPARSQVLMLDCCYSGAFARALRPKGDDDAAGLAGTFGSTAGRGRVILVASSAIEFTPASELFYVETEVTSYLSGSQCGLALQNQAGFVLTVGLGNGQVIARLYSGGTEANSGFWEVAMTDPVETEIGLWVDGTAVTI